MGPLKRSPKGPARSAYRRKLFADYTLREELKGVGLAFLRDRYCFHGSLQISVRRSIKHEGDQSEQFGVERSPRGRAFEDYIGAVVRYLRRRRCCEPSRQNGDERQPPHVTNSRHRKRLPSIPADSPRALATPTFASSRLRSPAGCSGAPPVELFMASRCHGAPPNTLPSRQVIVSSANLSISSTYKPSVEA